MCLNKYPPGALSPRNKPLGKNCEGERLLEPFRYGMELVQAVKSRTSGNTKGETRQLASPPHPNYYYYCRNGPGKARVKRERFEIVR